MHVQCLGKERIFSFDLRKAIKLRKNSFIGGPCKVAVDLVDTPYYHTPFCIKVKVLQRVAVLLTCCRYSSIIVLIVVAL